MRAQELNAGPSCSVMFEILFGCVMSYTLKAMRTRPKSDLFRRLSDTPSVEETTVFVGLLRFFATLANLESLFFSSLLRKVLARF